MSTMVSVKRASDEDGDDPPKMPRSDSEKVEDNASPSAPNNVTTESPTRKAINGALSTAVSGDASGGAIVEQAPLVLNLMEPSLGEALMQSPEESNNTEKPVSGENQAQKHVAISSNDEELDINPIEPRTGLEEVEEVTHLGAPIDVINPLMSCASGEYSTASNEALSSADTGDPPNEELMEQTPPVTNPIKSTSDGTLKQASEGGVEDSSNDNLATSGVVGEERAQVATPSNGDNSADIYPSDSTNTEDVHDETTTGSNGVPLGADGGSSVKTSNEVDHRVSAGTTNLTMVHSVEETHINGGSSETKEAIEGHSVSNQVEHTSLETEEQKQRRFQKHTQKNVEDQTEEKINVPSSNNAKDLANKSLDKTEEIQDLSEDGVPLHDVQIDPIVSRRSISVTRAQNIDVEKEASGSGFRRGSRDQFRDKSEDCQIQPGEEDERFQSDDEDEGMPVEEAVPDDEEQTEEEAQPARKPRKRKRLVTSASKANKVRKRAQKRYQELKEGLAVERRAEESIEDPSKNNLATSVVVGEERAQVGTPSNRENSAEISPSKSTNMEDIHDETPTGSSGVPLSTDEESSVKKDGKGNDPSSSNAKDLANKSELDKTEEMQDQSEDDVSLHEVPIDPVISRRSISANRAQNIDVEEEANGFGFRRDCQDQSRDRSEDFQIQPGEEDERFQSDDEDEDITVEEAVPDDEEQSEDEAQPARKPRKRKRLVTSASKANKVRKRAQKRYQELKEGLAVKGISKKAQSSERKSAAMNSKSSAVQNTETKRTRRAHENVMQPSPDDRVSRTSRRLRAQERRKEDNPEDGLDQMEDVEQEERMAAEEGISDDEIEQVAQFIAEGDAEEPERVRKPHHQKKPRKKFSTVGSRANKLRLKGKLRRQLEKAKNEENQWIPNLLDNTRCSSSNTSRSSRTQSLPWDSQFAPGASTSNNVPEDFDDSQDSFEGPSTSTQVRSRSFRPLQWETEFSSRFDDDYESPKSSRANSLNAYGLESEADTDEERAANEESPATTPKKEENKVKHSTDNNRTAKLAKTGGEMAPETNTTAKLSSEVSLEQESATSPKTVSSLSPSRKNTSAVRTSSSPVKAVVEQKIEGDSSGVAESSMTDAHGSMEQDHGNKERPSTVTPSTPFFTPLINPTTTFERNLMQFAAMNPALLLKISKAKEAEKKPERRGKYVSTLVESPQRSRESSIDRTTLPRPNRFDCPSTSMRYHSTRTESSQRSSQFDPGASTSSFVQEYFDESPDDYQGPSTSSGIRPVQRRAQHHPKASTSNNIRSHQMESSQFAPGASTSSFVPDDFDDDLDIFDGPSTSSQIRSHPYRPSQWETEFSSRFDDDYESPKSSREASPDVDGMESEAEHSEEEGTESEDSDSAQPSPAPTPKNTSKVVKRSTKRSRATKKLDTKEESGEEMEMDDAETSEKASKPRKKARRKKVTAEALKARQRKKKQEQIASKQGYSLKQYLEVQREEKRIEKLHAEIEAKNGPYLDMEPTPEMIVAQINKTLEMERIDPWDPLHMHMVAYRERMIAARLPPYDKYWDVKKKMAMVNPKHPLGSAPIGRYDVNDDGWEVEKSVPLWRRVSDRRDVENDSYQEDGEEEEEDCQAEEMADDDNERSMVDEFGDSVKTSRKRKSAAMKSVKKREPAAKKKRTTRKAKEPLESEDNQDSDDMNDLVKTSNRPKSVKRKHAAPQKKRNSRNVQQTLGTDDDQAADSVNATRSPLVKRRKPVSKKKSTSRKVEKLMESEDGQDPDDMDDTEVKVSNKRTPAKKKTARGTKRTSRKHK